MTSIQKKFILTIFLLVLACLVIFILHLIGYEPTGFVYQLF